MPDFLKLGTKQQKISLALISPRCKASVQPTEKSDSYTYRLPFVPASFTWAVPSKNKTQHDSVDVTIMRNTYCYKSITNVELQIFETLGKQTLNKSWTWTSFTSVKLDRVPEFIVIAYSGISKNLKHPIRRIFRSLKTIAAILNMSSEDAPQTLLFGDPSNWCHESWSRWKKAWLKATNFWGDSAML